MNRAETLIANNLCRRFGRRWALARLDFQIEPGESVLLLGPNGAGKTTLLRVLATALKPHMGHVTWGGQDLWKHRATIRKDFALLSHNSALYSDLSARQNLETWGRLGDIQPDVRGLLDRVNLKDNSAPVRTYSAGMKRRLALARVMMRSPKLILFDEPFSALDPKGRDLVGDVLAEMRRGGATLILSTHLVELGRQHTDRAICLESGQLRWTGPSDQADVHGARA